MSSVGEQIAKQLANVERATGRSVEEWTAIIHHSGVGKHHLSTLRMAVGGAVRVAWTAV